MNIKEPRCDERQKREAREQTVLFGLGRWIDGGGLFSPTSPYVWKRHVTCSVVVNIWQTFTHTAPVSKHQQGIDTCRTGSRWPHEAYPTFTVGPCTACTVSPLKISISPQTRLYQRQKRQMRALRVRHLFGKSGHREVSCVQHGAFPHPTYHFV